MTKVMMAVVAWWQAAIRHCHVSVRLKWLQKKVDNQPELVVVAMVAAAVVAWQQLPCNIVQCRMELAGKGGNNKPEGAMAVVAAAMQHSCDSMQHTIELAGKKKKINQRWQWRWWHASSCHATLCSTEWNWLEKRKTINRRWQWQWWQLLCNIIVAACSAKWNWLK